MKYMSIIFLLQSVIFLQASDSDDRSSAMNSSDSLSAAYSNMNSEIKRDFVNQVNQSVTAETQTENHSLEDEVKNNAKLISLVNQKNKNLRAKVQAQNQQILEQDKKIDSMYNNHKELLLLFHGQKDSTIQSIANMQNNLSGLDLKVKEEEQVFIEHKKNLGTFRSKVSRDVNSLKEEISAVEGKMRNLAQQVCLLQAKIDAKNNSEKKKNDDDDVSEVTSFVSSRPASNTSTRANSPNEESLSASSVEGQLQLENAENNEQDEIEVKND